MCVLGARSFLALGGQTTALVLLLVPEGGSTFTRKSICWREAGPISQSASIVARPAHAAAAGFGKVQPTAPASAAAGAGEAMTPAQEC